MALLVAIPRKNSKGLYKMKGFLKFIATILTVIMAIWDIFEFLAIPALFVVIGLLNSYSWRYYVITIIAYVIIFALIELIAHLVSSQLDEKYTPLIVKKLEKYFGKPDNE